MRSGLSEVLLTQVRRFVYEHFVREGGAPKAARVAQELGLDEALARAAFEELDGRHVLVLEPESREIWMAMPFSARRTSVSVRVGESRWWANCAWDALGIPAMLGRDAHIEARCPLGGEMLELDVDPDGPRSDSAAWAVSGRVHFALPAARWWDDIGLT